jgi:hypothetical protein
MKPIKRLFAVIIFTLACVSSAFAQFYVDPTYSGGTHDGNAATPWLSLSDSGAWSTITGGLASNDVTVYFSARLAGSDANETDTHAIDLTNVGTGTSHRLTLDGISKYNTNDASPSWVTYNNSPVNPHDCGTNCKQFQITASIPLTSNPGPGSTINYVTVRGFRLIATGGQVAYLGGLGNTIVEYSELSANNTVSFGPGMILGATSQGTDKNAGSHNQLRYNYVHNTWGECIYITGTSTDPGDGTGYSVMNGLSVTPVTGSVSGTGLTVNVTDVWPSSAIKYLAIANGGTGYVSGDLGHNMKVVGGNNDAQFIIYSISGGAVTALAEFLVADDIKISHNYIEKCAEFGGSQGDGIDVKRR